MTNGIHIKKTRISPGKETGRTWDQKKKWDHPDHRILKIRQNTYKSSGVIVTGYHLMAYQPLWVI